MKIFRLPSFKVVFAGTLLLVMFIANDHAAEQQALRGRGAATVLPDSACIFTLNPVNVDLPAKGGARTLKVKAKGANCRWTATSNDAFITITAGTTGTGNGTVHYTVPFNTHNSPLAGTITVAGQIVTVNQAAGGCMFKLSPSSAKFSFIGTVAGHETVQVKANSSACAWTAVSNDSFIIITGGASGIGNGTVSYTVASNPDNALRTGTITIGGEQFTITESSVLP